MYENNKEKETAEIRHIIFDYDGVFTSDNYAPVINAFEKSSGINRKEVEMKIGEHERKYVLSVSSKEFFNDLKKEFNSLKGYEEIAELLNQRGDSGLYEEMYNFVNWKNEKSGRGLSILSNQLAYRVPYVRANLDEKVGLENFERVWFSPEIGLQKPFVGVNEDNKSNMDVSGVNIFPFVVSQMKYLGFNPNECVFIDDSKKNVDGWIQEEGSGIVCESVGQIMRELREEYRVNI